MKYKINICAGGIFSKYMNVIQNLNYMQINDPNEYYINIIDERTDSNMFDFIFEQNLESEACNLDCIIMYPYFNKNKIEESPNLYNYKKIVENFRFKDNILKKVHDFKKKSQITEKTVGLHVRLTDMTFSHVNEYGNYNFGNYSAILDSEHEYFVASDNEESIEKLQKEFGDNIKFLPNLIRGKLENENTLNLQLENFKNPVFWEEAFIDMLLLSECGTLICNTSNLANASIIHSNSIKKVIRP